MKASSSVNFSFGGQIMKKMIAAKKLLFDWYCFEGQIMRKKISKLKTKITLYSLSLLKGEI